MIITPNNLENVIRNMQDPSKQIQQAGIDLTVYSIQRFNESGYLSVDNADRVLPKVKEVDLDSEGNFILDTGGYVVRYNESVHVPLNAAGLTLPRSTLMRMGATVHSAVWDPGYEGKGMGLMTVFNPVKIQKNARIAQIIFFSLMSEVENGYSGKYQGEGL